MWENICKFFGVIIDFFVGGINFLLGGVMDLILTFLATCGLTIEFPADIYSILNEITIGVGYIIPVRALLPIPLFMITYYTVKLVFSIYHLIAGTIIKRVKLKL